MIRMIAAGVAMLSVFYGSARGAEKFENVAVYLEQTAEDEDCEIAFEAVSATAGLAALKVVAPDGRTVIDFRTADSKLGMQHLILESPEPKNDGRLQADFPPGVYKFMGASVAGRTLGGEATLSHRLPGVTRIVRPRPDEKNVPTTGLQVRWNPVKEAAAFILVIEDEKAHREIKANLVSSATTFTVPEGFLASGTEYKVAIGTVARDGNRSFTETAFTTTEKK
jgi:hypothetical protein